MRSRLIWPASVQQWLPGLMVSIPLASLLLLTHSTDLETRAIIATVAVLLSIPWVVPVTMLAAVFSAPIYMWLHTQGPVPPVLDWLGGVVLVAAVIGCHVNAALLAAWWCAKRADVAEEGLRDFLFKREHGQDHRFH